MFPCQPRSLLAGVLLASALPAHAELPHAPAYIDDSAYPAAARQRILPPMFEQKLGSLRYLAKPGDPLITQAESSDFQRTSDYRETRAYLEKLVAASSGRIALRELPERSAEGHPMLLVTASTEADKSAAGLKRSAKPTLLVEAEIHPGEANGKDAMFMLLRDMSAADRPLAGLLEKINLLFIPVVNVDGDLRRSAYGLESLGHMVHECISLNDNQDPTQGYYPYRTDLARFSNQYGDIRNVPSILIEQHALHPYKTQVLGNYVMLKAMFEVIGEQAASLRQAIASDRERLLRQKEVILTWKPGEATETPFVVGDYRYEQSPVTGARTIVWSNRPKTLKLPVTDNGVPDLVVPRPQRFIVPAQWHEVIARIKAHGIRYTTLERPTEIAVTLYRMDDIKLADGFEPDRVQGNRIPGYEGRLLVSGTPKPFQRLQTFPAGSLSIDTAQPLGVLAIDLLQPQSPDSFWSWGFFNSTLVAAEEPEEYVMEPMARKMLAEDPALKAAFDKRLREDKAFAADPQARLQWFYQRTPFYDVNAFVYPVGVVF